MRAGNPGCGDQMPLLQKLAGAATGWSRRCSIANRNSTKHHEWDGHSKPCDGTAVDVLDRLDPGNLFGICGATGNPQ
jgi:hypothetical protein